ncbi:MAG: hypothetical protein J7K40_02505 [candidate division Zixibacteria bacterium]|nr:hypothetical protein [candidate division Zixibacteria bacterium]
MAAKGKTSKNTEKNLGFGKLNFILLAVGLGMIVIGYIFLAIGDITIAPILLVLGYCGVLPAAILVHKRNGSGAQSSES